MSTLFFNIYTRRSYLRHRRSKNRPDHKRGMSRAVMYCWDRMVFPLRRGWFRVSKRLGFRKTGLVKLHHDVRACQYEDVRVMWDLLNKNGTEVPGGPSQNKERRRPFLNILEWAKCAPSLCRSF